MQAWLVPVEWAAEVVAEQRERRPYNGPRATTVGFRRRSWAPDPEPGEQTAPVWRYRLAWVTEVAWAIASPEGRAKLRWVQPGGRAESISPATFLAAAKEAATYADHGTGRNVTVGRARLGRAVSRSERTMTRFWRAANALGFSRTRAKGRYLTTAERKAAYRRHGNRQLRMAAQRDLIGLRRRSFVHLPSEGGLKAPEALSEMVKHQRASSQEGAAASRPHSPNNVLQNQPPTSRPGRVIWSREMFEFARAIRTLLPWLRDAHPASIARVLHRAGVTPERWEARDLARRLQQELGFRANAGRFGQQSDRPARAFRFMDPNEVSDPLGYTRWLLAEYIDPAEPTLTEDRAEYRADQVQQAVDQLDAAAAEEARRQELRAERVARLAEQFARREEALAERERVAGEAAQIQAIRAESDAEIARRRADSHDEDSPGVAMTP